jgi:hypothetical protein
MKRRDGYATYGATSVDWVQEKNGVFVCLPAETADKHRINLSHLSSDEIDTLWKGIKAETYPQGIMLRDVNLALSNAGHPAMTKMEDVPFSQFYQTDW